MDILGTASRPRVSGDREREIFAAALDLVAEAGYDKLTLDAVASRARASKATLYRRWTSKAELVLDAISCTLHTVPELAAPPDTGSLRGDLVALGQRKGLLQPERAGLVCGLATAMYRDPELRAGIGRRFAAPNDNQLRGLLERARSRGEVRADADLDLLCQVIPAMVFFQLSVTTPGQLSPDFVLSVIDEVLLPAVRPPG